MWRGATARPGCRVRVRASRAALRAPASRFQPLTPLTHTRHRALVPFDGKLRPATRMSRLLCSGGCHFNLAGTGPTQAPMPGRHAGRSGPCRDVGVMGPHLCGSKAEDNAGRTRADPLWRIAEPRSIVVPPDGTPPDKQGVLGEVPDFPPRRRKGHGERRVRRNHPSTWFPRCREQPVTAGNAHAP